MRLRKRHSTQVTEVCEASSRDGMNCRFRTMISIMVVGFVLHTQPPHRSVNV